MILRTVSGKGAEPKNKEVTNHLKTLLLSYVLGNNGKFLTLNLEPSPKHLFSQGK